MPSGGHLVAKGGLAAWTTSISTTAGPVWHAHLGARHQNRLVGVGYKGIYAEKM